MTHTTVFVDFSCNKLLQLMGRIRESVDSLTEEQIWVRGSDNENAVGNLLLHLSGNVRQWIIASIGRKPDVRVRDREFSARGDISKADLVDRLSTIVDEAVSIIRGVSSERMLERIQVQKYDVTILEAIYHVVEHFSQHTGQVVFATKLMTGSDLAFYKQLSGQGRSTDPTP
jgi:hypothetical protein